MAVQEETLKVSLVRVFSIGKSLCQPCFRLNKKTFRVCNWHENVAEFVSALCYAVAKNRNIVPPCYAGSSKGWIVGSG